MVTSKEIKEACYNKSAALRVGFLSMAHDCPPMEGWNWSSGLFYGMTTIAEEMEGQLLGGCRHALFIEG